MTQEQIWQIARQQSAFDLGCEAEDFLKNENLVVLSRKNERARRYLELPFSCQLTSYGRNIVASVLPEFHALTEEYIQKYPVEHCFETPHLHALNEALAAHGQKICFMAEYFLAEQSALKEQPCAYELRLLRPRDFKDLYLPQWNNALCEKRKELDVLGVGAYDGERLVGFAGCSADCEEMWQIGVDVLPSYRRQGVAAAVTSKLALEILARDKVPFYCAAWSNIGSVRNAIRSGFRPAWVEMTAKPFTFVEDLNQR